MELSVIIPAFNEENNIKILLHELDAILKPVNHEIILVDDHSTDSTLSEAQSMDIENLKIISLPQRKGQSWAINVGMELSQGEYIALIDGDLQNSPHDILLLLEQLKKTQADMVQGYRIQRLDSPIKNIPSYVANIIIRYIFSVDLKDIGCSLKIFRRAILNKLNYFDGFHRYIPLLAHLEGFKIEQIPIKHGKRLHGKSKYGLSRITHVIKQIYTIRKKYKENPAR